MKRRHSRKKSRKHSKRKSIKRSRKNIFDGLNLQQIKEFKSIDLNLLKKITTTTDKIYEDPEFTFASGKTKNWIKIIDNVGIAEEYSLTKIKSYELKESIEESDILHQDDLICILRPEVKKGIIIWSEYTQPKDKDTLCKLGLKTGEQLEKEGVKFGRSIFHPYIFFRAPYYSRKINYTTPEDEIFSSYDKINMKSKVFIRVDPTRTFVFSSEIRSGIRVNENIIKSKKTLSEYLKIIKQNSLIENAKKMTDQKILYNLFTSEAQLFQMSYRIKKPFDKYNSEPINRNSEILVSIPHLTPEYFVLCTTDS